MPKRVLRPRSAITGDGVISVDTLLASPPEALTNPIRTRADWEAMRAAALADPGAFHGDIAARNMHWFVAEASPAGAWLARAADGRWHGWDAASGAPVSPALSEGFTPWHTGFDGSNAPHWRWFVGGRTNAAFSELVL